MHKKLPFPNFFVLLALDKNSKCKAWGAVGAIDLPCVCDWAKWIKYLIFLQLAFPVRGFCFQDFSNTFGGGRVFSGQFLCFCAKSFREHLFMLNQNNFVRNRTGSLPFQFTFPSQATEGVVKLNVAEFRRVLADPRIIGICPEFWSVSQCFDHAGRGGQWSDRGCLGSWEKTQPWLARRLTKWAKKDANHFFFWLFCRVVPFYSWHPLTRFCSRQFSEH